MSSSCEMLPLASLSSSAKSPSRLFLESGFPLPLLLASAAGGGVGDVADPGDPGDPGGPDVGDVSPAAGAGAPAPAAEAALPPERGVFPDLKKRGVLVVVAAGAYPQNNLRVPARAARAAANCACTSTGTAEMGPSGLRRSSRGRSRVCASSPLTAVALGPIRGAPPSKVKNLATNE